MPARVVAAVEEQIAAAERRLTRLAVVAERFERGGWPTDAAQARDFIAGIETSLQALHERRRRWLARVAWQPRLAVRRALMEVVPSNQRVAEK